MTPDLRKPLKIDEIHKIYEKLEIEQRFLSEGFYKGSRSPLRGIGIQPASQLESSKGFCGSNGSPLRGIGIQSTSQPASAASQLASPAGQPASREQRFSWNRAIESSSTGEVGGRGGSL